MAEQRRQGKEEEREGEGERERKSEREKERADERVEKPSGMEISPENENGRGDEGHSPNQPRRHSPPSSAHNIVAHVPVNTPPHLRPEVACTDLGTQLKLMGKVKEGMAKYAEAIRLNANYAPAYYNIAVVYSESRNYEEAIRFYKMAIERNPNYIEAYCNIGIFDPFLLFIVAFFSFAV